MHPLTTLPKQFNVCREAQVTLVTGCVCQAQILILKIVFPFVIQYALKAVYVKKRRKTVADGTHYLAVLDGVEGSISTPQNICMWILPLSISIKPSSDRPVYDLRNMSAISPSAENNGFFPHGLLWTLLVNSAANSLMGSCA